MWIKALYEFRHIQKLGFYMVQLRGLIESIKSDVRFIETDSSKDSIQYRTSQVRSSIETPNALLSVF